MIQCNKGIIKMSGTPADILTDLSTIVHSMNESEYFSKETIRNAAEAGLMTPEELDEKIAEKRKELLAELMAAKEGYDGKRDCN